MTDKKKPAKKKKATNNQHEPSSAVPLEEKEDVKPEQAATTAPTTEKNQSASKPDPKPAADVKKEDDGKDETIGPLSKCKVYGQPDVHHKKCRLCKDLESCLTIDALLKRGKKKGTKSAPRGTDFIGFQKGSQKSAFATHIAKQPMHMRDVKSAPWNKKELTWYDTFNELRRNTTEEGEPLPLATKSKDGVMCILEKNLTKDQKEKMREEIEKFPY
jgi:hypothetical protein